MLPNLDRIAAIALAVLLALASIYGVAVKRELSKTQGTLANERATRATETAQRAETARASEHEYRKLEERRTTYAQENASALAKDQVARAVARERERAAHDSLRHDVAAFRAAGGRGSSETCPAELAAERDRSATLGDLFSEADEAAGEMEDAAERHADEARALKRQLEADRSPTGAAP